MNRRRIVLALAGAVALVVVAGGLIASNMGFVLNLHLQERSTGLSAAGINIVSLPYHHLRTIDLDGDGTLTAGELLIDINDGPCKGTPAAAVQRFLPESDSLFGYDGCSGEDFGLRPGEAVLVLMREGHDYRIVGTHDPNLVIPFLGPSPGLSKSGTNLYAPPYHALAATASELLEELGPSAQIIYRFVPETEIFEVYSFGFGSDFPLQPGEGYFVRVSSDVNFQPAHY